MTRDGSNNLAQHGPVRVSDRRSDSDGNRIRVSFNVTGLAEDRLWFSIPAAYSGMLSQAYDVAAVALLMPTMAAGSALQLDGPATPELIWALNRTAVPILQETNDALGQCVVQSSEEVRGKTGKDTVATGLTNGIDSFNVILDHFVNDTAPTTLRLTHILFNDVGGNNSVKPVELNQGRWKKVQEVAQELALPIIRVTSNLDRFYQLRFQATHTMRNASVPFLLSAGIGTWLYASGCSFNQVCVGQTHEVAKLDPILLPGITIPGLDLVSVGGHLSRVEKTQRLADGHVAQRHLNVCVREVENCSACWKCLRTLLTLELLGKLDGFERTFDLDIYAAYRDSYIAEVLASDDRLLGELRDLMNRVEFEPGIHMRGRAYIRRVKASIPGSLKAPYRKARDLLTRSGLCP